MDFRDRRPVLMVMGIFLLAAGGGAALLAPLEMYCFYLFSEGGRFHYQGFGFGSFMFGNIASQIIGYYAIAGVLIPLGYGHLRVRRWARALSLALLRVWLVVGMPVIVVIFLVLVGSKDLSLPAVLVATVSLALSYVVLPALLSRFYNSRSVRETFETQDPRSDGIAGLPIPLLALCCLYLFYAVTLHIPIFFRGLFPFFGTFVSDLQGFLLLDASILLLGCLAWGTLRQRAWAWWGGLIYFGLLTFSSILTPLRFSYADLLSLLEFPATEVALLDGVPLQGFHLATFFGVPLLATLAAIILSRRHFRPWSPT
jgi:hypothetical protein